MRILYAITGYGGEHLGGAIHPELAREILALGHTYEIFAAAHQKDMEGRSAAAVEDGVTVHRAVCAGRTHLDLVNGLFRPVFRFPWFVPCLIAFVRFLRSRPPYDVVIAESAYPLGAIAYLATRLVRQPFVVSVTGGDFIASDEANYGYARYRVARLLMRRAFEAAAIVRTVSPYAAEPVRRLGCPPGKLAVLQRNIARGAFLPAGVDREAYRREARERLACRFGLAAGPLVVAVGRLLPIKGFDDLLRALPAVAAALPDVRLLLVGPNRSDERLGDYQKHLEGLAGQLGVRARIVFAGALPQEEVRDCLVAADVVAVPSVEEGGNKIVLEAAAVGTPFVATRAAGTPDWAREWECGLIVAPCAPGELAVALVQALSDPDSAAAMGRSGRRFAESFRPEVVAARLIDLCRCATESAPLTDDLRLPQAVLRPAGAAKGQGA